MKNAIKYCVDIKKMCDVKGHLHVYFIDTNNVIIACNKLKAEFFRDICGCDNIIGNKLLDVLKASNHSTVEACYRDNLNILKNGLPRQTYHSWSVKGLYRLDLLTFKMPIYDTLGKPLGIFIVSHFLNKFSVQQAFNLGLTKRETECLFYLLEGNSAKEIAKALKLSPRTVEGYIDNMKDKLNCATTSELLLKALQNQVKTSIDNIFTPDMPNPLSEFMEGNSTYNSMQVDLT